MPELPEVETVVRDLRTKINGAIIAGIKIRDGRVIRQGSHKEFVRRLNGQSFCDIFRRGKAILIRLRSGDILVVQLMMTGQLILTDDPAPHRDTKVTFRLSNEKTLHYNDYRTFGRLLVVARPDEIPYFRSIGPEPLEKDFTVAWLSTALRKRGTPIKPLLLNHQFVAGIGNIYASEILFQSRIHPQRPASTLNQKEIALLHRATQKVLREAIRFRGTSMNTYRDTEGQKGRFMGRIKVYGRERDQCFDCGGPVERIAQAGRSTFYCPRCQK